MASFAPTSGMKIGSPVSVSNTQGAPPPTAPPTSGTGSDPLAALLQQAGYGGGPFPPSGSPTSGTGDQLQRLNAAQGGYNPAIVNALIQSLFSYGGTQAQTSIDQLKQYLNFAVQQMQPQIKQGERDITERYGGMGLGASSAGASALGEYLSNANMDISQLAQTGTLSISDMLSQNNAQMNALASSMISESWQQAINNILQEYASQKQAQGPSALSQAGSFIGALF